MSSDHPTESAPDDAQTPPVPPLPDARRDAPAVAEPADKSNRKRNLALIGAGAAIVIAGAVTSIVLLVTQPTGIERAADACAGTQPLDRFLAANTDVDAEEAKENIQEGGDTGELEKYFDGVVTVEDGGTTLIVNTMPQDDDPLGISAMALTCVQEQLDAPAWLSESMGTTRSLDGRQTGEWGSYSAQWSYHPDNGMNLIIVQK